MTITPLRATGQGYSLALAGIEAAASSDVAACLAARGLPRASSVAIADLASAIGDGAVVGVWIDPTPAASAQLAPAARAAAAAGRPMVVLAQPSRPRALETTAALAYLRAHGAVVTLDPDLWLEVLCLLWWHGLPEGPRAAVIAPEGSWVAIAAASLGDEDGRRPAVSSSSESLAPVDVALIAGPSWDQVPGRKSTPALLIPVVARAELADRGPAGALFGLRIALAAVTAVGRAAERIRTGLGPATRTSRAELEVDEDRLARQLGKIAATDKRLGDHETKVLLAAYGVAITRQAVATTASAALRIAKKAGFPVDIKPWGPDVPTERSGCPIESGIATAAEVRRAYAAVLNQGGAPAPEDGAVIVRETPPSGREVSAAIAPLDALGWTVVVEVGGLPPVCAPAPLRAADASALAAILVATRAGDGEPDRAGLANVLRRASHLAVEHQDRIARLELARIVVGAKGERTVVVDAVTHLR